MAFYRYLDDLRGLFQDAIVIIHSNTTLNDKERDIIQQANCLEDIQFIVQRAKEQYDRTSKSTVKHWLIEFSKRICYYGNIMDVLVQQHPEYVSLAWGSLKLLFVVRSSVIFIFWGNSMHVTDQWIF